MASFPRARTELFPKMTAAGRDDVPSWQRAYATLAEPDNPAAGEQGDGEDGLGGCICSMITNRQREVGFVAFEPSTMRLYLAQYIEGGKSAAAITALLLKVHDAMAAVVLAANPRHAAEGSAAADVSADAGDLMHQVSAYLPEEIHALPRSAFDDSKAREALQTLATPESWSKLQHTASSGLYLAFGAAGALLHHLQASAEHLVMAGSLHVEVVGTTAHLCLDAGSLDCLEILPRPGHAIKLPFSQPHPFKRTTAGPDGGGGAPPANNFKPHLAHRSLLDLMNHTRTSVGARLLRASLLQPLTDTAALALRYDAVEELLCTPQLQQDVAQVLVALPKRLDKLCSSVASSQGTGPTSKGDPSRRISASVTAVLLLRSALQLVPRLADALEGCESALLRAVHTTCREPAFGAMLDHVQQVMDPDAAASTSAFVNRIQQCFAVKAGTDNVLDVARSSFCRITEQVHTLADQYRTTLAQSHNALGGGGRGGAGGQDALAVKVNYTDRSGFYLAVSWSERKQDASSLQDIVLPRSFLPLGKRSRTAVLATTHELNALNARLKDMAHDCLVLTEQVMDGLVQFLVSHMSLLLRLVDNVALTDMLLGFAQLAGSAPPGCAYCRPQLMNTGHTLAIAQGRHPLLERLPGCEVRSNDTHMDGDCCSLHIVTGPNMAGKSTYLKQVGLMVVMAQAGSMVPAAYMQLRPIQQLFTRMGHGDSIETNSSSFMVEMQEVGYILDHADEHSLVLMDELGRATSTLDGVAVSWAVCEALLASRTPTLIATHFAQLSDLAGVYPQARVWQLQVTVDGSQLNYSWQLQAAQASDAWSYGLALARTLGFPEHLLAAALRVSQAELERLTETTGLVSSQQPVLALASKLLSLAHTAVQATESSAEDEAGEDGQQMIECGTADERALRRDEALRLTNLLRALQLDARKVL